MKRFNPGHAVVALTFAGIAYFTLTGDVQNHIHFAGPLNEMGFCFLAICGCCLFAVLTFTKNSK